MSKIICVSVEISRMPSPDEYGDWGFRTSMAHFAEGLFTYAIETNDPEFFAQHVGDGWPKWMRKEVFGDD